MPNPLQALVKTKIENTSTRELRKVLASRVHARNYKCYVYAVLLCRRHSYQDR